MDSIKLSSVIFRYGAEFTLDIDFLEIPAGRITVIAGRNGAGKTTLLKLLAGIYTPFQGGISIGAKDIKTESALKRAGIFSYVPQSEEQEFGYTVWEITAMGRRPHGNALGILDEHDVKSVKEALELCDMADKKNREFKSLSGGEKRLALAARAIAQDSLVMLLDEPSAFLDIGHQAKIFGILKANRDKSKTVIMVTHDINAAFDIADNVILMSGGKVIASGNTDTVLTEENIRGAYGFDKFGLADNPETGKKSIFLKI